MTSFRIEGQRPLKGTIEVNGSKNSALKILAACLLVDEPVILHRVPRIEDVHRLLDLLASVGAQCTWIGDHSLELTCTTINPSTLDFALVGKLRASVILMGALVARCGSMSMPGPGGDQIGARPLDAHLQTLRALGVRITNEGNLYTLQQGSRSDVDYTMPEFSVTATENALLASVLQEGKKILLRCAAAEPSVQDLCWFLQSLGAQISGIGTHTLMIEGVRKLRVRRDYTIIPDPVEAGTFLCLAAASRSEITVKDFPLFLYAEVQKFKEANVSFDIVQRRTDPQEKYDLADVVIHHSSQLKPIRSLHNMPYPGFHADLLPPFTVLLTQANGTSLVHDWMYEGRLKYVEELNKMGADIFISDPHRILVTGPRNLYGSRITNYDIRTGASLFIASLIAAGTSVVGPAYQLDRGYERLDERLKLLGASVERIEE